MGNRRSVFILGASMILYALCGAVAHGEDSDNDAAASLPKHWEMSCWLAKATLDSPTVPCSLRIHFEGDDSRAQALLVRERSGKRRRGLAVLSDDGQTVLIGAGKAVGASGDDLGWMGAWTVLQPLDADDRALHDEGSLAGQVLALLPADGCSFPTKGKGPLLVILRKAESAGDETRRKIAAEVWDLGEPRRRLAGLDALGGLNVQPIKGCLLPGLRDNDEAVRLETARVLAHSHVTEALSVLAGWLSPSSKEVSPFSRATVAHRVGELGGGDAVAVLERAAADPDWDVRKTAVEGLQTIGGAQGMAPIIDRLEDADARIRRVAVSAVGDLDDQRALAPLVKRFADPDLATRIAAIDAVARLKGESAAPEIVRLLRDPNPQVRERAAHALGELGVRSAVPELIRLLQQAPTADPDKVETIVYSRRAGREQTLPTDPRCAAARALGKLHEPKAGTELLRALKKATPTTNPRDKPSLLARDEAFAGCASGALLPLGERAVEPLVTCLEQGGACAPPAVVIEILGTLGKNHKTLQVSGKGQEAITNALLGCLSRGDTCAPPTTVVEALGRLGSKRAIPALIAELERERVSPQTVVEALSLIDDPRVAPALLAELARPRAHASNPTTILAALEKTHDAGIVVPLLEFAKTSQTIWLRLQALRAVKPVLDARAELLLLDLLDDDNWSLKEEVMGLLSKLRSRAALPKALELLAAKTHGDPRIAEDLRWTAMTMLTDMGGPGGSATPEILPPLFAMAKAPSHLSAPALAKARKRVAQDEPHACEASGLMEPTAYAMRALGGLFRARPDGNVRLLVEAQLAHANEARVLAAIGALAAMRDPASIPRLLPLAGSRNLDIRRAVVAVLGDFVDRSVTAGLLAALHDKDDSVRGAAAWALGKLGDTTTLPQIVKATNNRGEATAVNATAALARFADPSTLDHLEKLTKHWHHHVRGNAAVALGRLGGDRARGILLAMARSDPATSARLAAFRALHDMGGPDPELRKAATAREGSDGFVAAALAILEDKTQSDRTTVKDSWVLDHHVPHWLVALTLPDRLVRVGTSDLCGVFFEEQVPSGDVSLYGASLTSE
jgi:HEAT repeat protein